MDNDPKDKKWFIETFFNIVNKEEREVQFKLNAVQLKYYENRTKRDIILKARKQGISSYILADFLHECIVKENVNCVVMSHERESTKDLLSRVKFYIDHLKYPVQLSRRSDEALVFPKTNSSFRILTAGMVDPGRGSDINRLHLSEYASYEKMRTGLTHQIHAATLQAVPDAGRIVIETTARGIDSPFHRLYKSSKQGETGWNICFFGWNDSLEHQATAPDGMRLGEKEKYLKDTFDLTNDQLFWRRNGIKEMPDHEYDEDTRDWRSALWNQEFPLTDTDAFISSEVCVFNATALQKQYDQAKPAKFRGIFEGGGFRKEENGWVEIWEMPQLNEEYVIGADVGYGREKGDWSIGNCISVRTRKQVAKMRMRISPDLFGKELMKFGTFYHTAMIAPEWTGPGTATSLKLYEDNYSAIYRPKKYITGREQEMDRIGVETTGKSKEIGVNLLKKELREGLKILSKETIAEMLNFVYKPGRVNPAHIRMEAESGYDDEPMSLVMATFALSEYEREKEEVPEVPKFSMEWIKRRLHRMDKPNTILLGGSRFN